MKKCIVWILLALAMANTAQAEEVVLLEKGKTMWGILQARGCTTVQTAAVWRQIAADSGLNPAHEKRWMVGTPLTFKRDCHGQERVEQAPVASSTNPRNDGPELPRKPGAAESDKLSATATPAGSSRIWQVATGLLALTTAILAVLLFLSRRTISRQEAANASLTATVSTMEDNLQFPSDVRTEHRGKDYTFTRVVNSADRTIGYKCPIDSNHVVFWASDCPEHMWNDHQQEGQVVYEDDLSGSFASERDAVGV